MKALGHALQLTCFSLFLILSSTLLCPGQNNFKLGVGVGPAFPVLEFSEEDQAKGFTSKIQLGMHASVIVQYLFDDKVGLETGFLVTIQKFQIKPHGLSMPKKILADSYAMPFLFVYKANLRSTPFVNLQFLVGPVIEFPTLIPITGSAKHDIHYNHLEKIMVNVDGGFRVCFIRDGRERLAAGLTYSHKSKPAYEFNPRNTALHLNPKAHSLKLQIAYFLF